MNDKPDESETAKPDSQTLPSLPRPSRWPAVLALLSLLAVTVLIAAGHFYWQNMQSRFAHLRLAMEQSRQQQETLIRQVEETNRAFQEQRERLQAQERLISSQTRTITEQAEKLEAERERLASQGDAVKQSLKNLHDQVGRTGHQWRAAEAAYLLELAQSRLQLERDTQTAAKALQSAAERLRETGDPRWEAARGAIARDLLRLDAVQEVDREDLSKTLLQLAVGVEKLPLRTKRYQARLRPEATGTAPREERNLDTLIQDGWEAFKSLVRVHRDEWTASSPIGPEHHDSVRQNLRLQLDAARFGLLRKDLELYRGSLDTAAAWLQTFFQQEAAETRLYLDEIQRLQGVDVHPPLPDLTPTLETLRAQLDAAAESSEDEAA